MLERQFPIIQARGVHSPRSVPWRLLADHEGQALMNHGQTLEHLAGRGGLDVFELWCVVHDVQWRRRANIQQVLTWLKPIENVVW
jgi:hypothetical protein